MRLVVMAGDLLVFVLFPLLGSAEHSGLGLVGAMARTTLPFALAWFVLSPLTGVYREAVLSSPAASVFKVMLAWPAAGIAALALRTVVFDRPWVWAFVIVSLLAQGALLVLWRLLYGLISRRMLDGARHRA